MKERTKEDIEIDFSRAISQAQELEEIARELSIIANAHIEGAMTMLENSWKGDNAVLMTKNGRILTEDMYDTADDLIKVARNIRNTADIVYRAEKAATQIVY